MRVVVGNMHILFLGFVQTCVQLTCVQLTENSRYNGAYLQCQNTCSYTSKNISKYDIRILFDSTAKCTSAEIPQSS